MKEKIIETLLKLDKTNDNQWTQDGLPKVDVLKFLSGGETWTRDQISEAAPGFTRSNPIIGDGSNGELNEVASEQPVEGEQGQASAQEQGSAEQEAKGGGAGPAGQQEAPKDETNVVTSSVLTKLTVDVGVNFPDLIKNFLMGLNFVDVKEMSDDELAELAAKHSNILSADNQFLSEVNEFVTKRAHYLNAVVEEQSKRAPAESQADMLAQFHARMFENQQNLPINKPRQLQVRGPQYFPK